MKFLKPFLFLLLLLNGNFALSQNWGNKPLIYSVINLDNQTYLDSKNLNEPHSMASLTKLMTAYVLIKNHPNLDNCYTKITQEERDDLKKTKTRLEKNEAVPCKKLIQAMLIVSDNWAASALSKTIPGVSQQKFVQMMNVQAREWAMKNTLYKDPSGLFPENISTAYDLNILLSKVMSDKLITQMSSQKDMVFIETSGNFLMFKNSNKLIREMHYEAYLSKTGYIKESGYNLMFVPIKKCNEKSLGFVVMGAKSSAKRADFMKSMLEKYNCSTS